jgi:paraquat-inducible protein B
MRLGRPMTPSDLDPEPGPAAPAQPPATVPDALPLADVAPRGGPSLVWLIPLVALAIGGWLAYKTYSEKGQTIHIGFKTAAGLTAGKTEVKFKDVAIGKVIGIDVTDDLTAVRVTAELVAGTERYLTEGTRFWVERPRVTASRVSGLETLLSGAYIAMDPVHRGASARDFVGLEEPPLFTTAEPGKQFALRAPTLGSLNVGSPVYYRDIQVGQVVGHDLDAEGKAVNIRIFVSAPHDVLVDTNTRFWNASGVDFSLTASGVRIGTQSLLSVLIGGVAFDNPETLEAAGKPATEGEVFPLYASRAEAHEKTYLNKERFLMYFGGSVRGLAIGAPVESRGIKVGQVLDIQLQLNADTAEFQIPVLVEIEPERIVVVGDQLRLTAGNAVERLVERGLRAQLKSGSLITGQLYVDLDFHPADRPQAVWNGKGFRIFPTVPAALDALTDKLVGILDTIAALPLAQIGNDMRDAIAGAKAVLASRALLDAVQELDPTLKAVRKAAAGFDADLMPKVALALDQVRATLKSADGLVAPDSATAVELRRLMQELGTAARSVRNMADYLERHPEALIKGKGGM